MYFSMYGYWIVIQLFIIMPPYHSIAPEEQNCNRHPRSTEVAASWHITTTAQIATICPFQPLYPWWPWPRYGNPSTLSTMSLPTVISAMSLLSLSSNLLLLVTRVCKMLYLRNSLTKQLVISVVQPSSQLHWSSISNDYIRMVATALMYGADIVECILACELAKCHRLIGRQEG